MSAVVSLWLGIRRWVRRALRLPHPLEGRRLAVVMIAVPGPDEADAAAAAGAGPDGDDDGDDGALLHGIVRRDGRRLVLDWNDGRLALDEAWLDDARPVSSDVRDILGDADYWVSVPVEPLPEDTADLQVEATGLVWPGSKAAAERDRRSEGFEEPGPGDSDR